MANVILAGAAALVSRARGIISERRLFNNVINPEMGYRPFTLSPSINSGQACRRVLFMVRQAHHERRFECGLFIRIVASDKRTLSADV